MHVLGIDTATGACSVALWRGEGADGTVVARRFEPVARGQAEILVPMVQAVLGDADVAFSDIDRFGVTVGPGAFTGLRVGLATVRGMALATGRPVVGVTTFEAIAHALPEAERAARRVLVMVDSRRTEIFAQLFGADLQALGDPLVDTPAGVLARIAPGPLIVAGDAAAQVQDAIAFRADTVRAAGPGFPDAAAVAALAAGRVGRAGAAAFPAPLYLRPPDARLPGGRSV